MLEETELRRRLPVGLAHNRLPPAQHKQSAVLVPLEPQRGVWLTKRSGDLPSHAGQVAFPGGKIESSDASAEAAALREAEEEISLPPQNVHILGRMDDFITGTGFHIIPVVGLILQNPSFICRDGEVQDVFCLPFETLLDPQAPRRRQAEWQGVKRQFWAWSYGRYVIWGATAEILLNLARLLRDAP
jgi:8-oxo-dGTP pyrophosphatase MutT (NUDIX family)